MLLPSLAPQVQHLVVATGGSWDRTLYTNPPPSPPLPGNWLESAGPWALKAP